MGQDSLGEGIGKATKFKKRISQGGREGCLFEWASKPMDLYLAHWIAARVLVEDIGFRWAYTPLWEINPKGW